MERVESTVPEREVFGEGERLGEPEGELEKALDGESEREYLEDKVTLEEPTEEGEAPLEYVPGIRVLVRLAENEYCQLEEPVTLVDFEAAVRGDNDEATEAEANKERVELYDTEGDKV